MRVRRIIPIVAFLALTGCDGTQLSFLNPQGPIASQQRTHFLVIIAFMTIVILPVLVLTPLLIWRYRYGKGASYMPEARLPWWIEIVLLGVPLMVVGVLGVLLWRNTAALDPWRPMEEAGAPLHIQVVGYDWKWLFIYPDQGVATVGEMVFPAGTPIAFELTSETVMQSFWIPALGGQVYAMGGGMVTQLHLMADRPGVFRGLNTQYNGLGFAEQQFNARAVPAAEFNAWVSAVRTEGAPLDDRAMSALARKNTAQDVARLLSPKAAADPVRLFPVPEAFFADLVRRASAPSHGGYGH
ncbi:MAG: cytochrome c oxidase subunit II [Allorhizobium sp.]